MKITNNMVERAARAICISDGGDPDDHRTRQGYAYEYFTKHARAALEAALNPPKTNKRDGEHG